jgi:uncharacterized protein with HEPN domain
VRDDKARISDIIDAINRIDKYSIQGYEIFIKDELIQTWILHHLQVIGEATSKLSKNFKSGHPEIQWNQINGFRNILVHHYFEIDYKLIWNTVERDLPHLMKKLQAIMRNLKQE